MAPEVVTTMIGNDAFVSVFGSVPPGDTSLLVNVVAFAVRSGYAVVLLEPDGVQPLDMRNARERKAGTELPALTLEWAGGDPAKVRTKVSAVLRRVIRELDGAVPNLGIELKASGLVAWPCDRHGATVSGLPGWWAITPSTRVSPAMVGVHVVAMPPSVVDGVPVILVGGLR